MLTLIWILLVLLAIWFAFVFGKDLQLHKNNMETQLYLFRWLKCNHSRWW